ncbi:MAG: PQQ-dependent sugar dehydrogenase [Deltaproteobacteria bacterium]|jgi:glucose/arabinose dehydrogenase|nr:PQQ-dependent sugar dehydrogenase [Deltaproteobacteria bacterium]
MRLVIGTTFALLFLVVAGAAAAATLPPGGTFLDDDGNVHEGNIEAIAAEGITVGCNPPWYDEYCPRKDVTRAQMAAMMVRALDLTDDGGRDWFVDDDGTWYEDSANKLAQAGITRGCNPPDNDRFCGADTITRGQFAAFMVRGYGYTDPGPGDRFVDDDDSIFEGDIDRLATAGVTLGCNPPDNDRFCPDGDVRRDQLASFLGRAEGLTAIVPSPRTTPEIETVATGLSGPLFLTSPDGDDRLFVVEKGGRIKIIDGGTVLPTPFLDISNLVSGGSEQGLLGMAFHPDYDVNGRFYVSYTDTGDDSRIVEYEVSADPNVADTSSSRNIIEISQPARNHNGGMILFDESGYLLFGLGDGGGAGDPQENAQNRNTLLGSMIRIGVDGDDFPSDSGRNYTIPSDNPFVGTSGADEIWAYGLRNPWRYSIDTDTGLLYIADVGQNRYEEVNIASADEGGINYGWDILEATHCYEPLTGCSSSGTLLPVVEYGRSGGCSVTGGYVYRGSEVTQLIGHYVYADFCAGVLRSFRYHPDAGVDAERVWNELGSLGQVSSFGVSGDDVFILPFDGKVLRLTAS